MYTKTRIMVIDDEEIIRDFIHEILSEEGYDLAVFDCGQKAVAEARNRRYEITITDLHMPGTDGLETMKNIRQINPHTEFLLIGSYPDKLLEIAREEREISYLPKPFGVKELLDMIQKISQNRIAVS